MEAKNEFIQYIYSTPQIIENRPSYQCIFIGTCHDDLDFFETCYNPHEIVIKIKRNRSPHDGKYLY
jgi:hypothetical protein